MLSGVQTGNGTSHDKYNIRGIAHVCTIRKDNIFRQRRLYIDKYHTVLDIFRTRGHNIDMNRAGILAWASVLQGSRLWPYRGQHFYNHHYYNSYHHNSNHYYHYHHDIDDYHYHSYPHTTIIIIFTMKTIIIIINIMIITIRVAFLRYRRYRRGGTRQVR